MAFHKIADISGSGFIDFGVVDTHALYRTHVTNFGGARVAGPVGTPQLYLNIGWISAQEAVPLGDGMDIAANFSFEPRWINLEFQDFDFFREATDFNGMTGITHVLQPGVVIDLYWFG